MQNWKKSLGGLLLIMAVSFASTLALISCEDKKEAASEPDSAESTVYDLYVMSLCPFGFTGVAEMMEVLRAFPQRKLNVWFIGRVEGDRLSSMRGEPEIYDQTLWLGVNALYPARYREFLSLRGSPKESTEAIIKKMGLDFGKIKHWADNVGRTELREHFIRGNNLGINASPTLLINDQRHAGRVGGGHFVRINCAAADPMPQFCKEYPECSDDNDCFMAGKLGICVNPGKMGKERATCEYRDDAAFTLTVLVADSPIDRSEGQVIDWYKRMLPGAKINMVKFSSEEGQQLFKQHNPPALPFFHLEQAVEGAHRFSTAAERLEKAVDGGYQVRRGMGVRDNYFPQRIEKPDLIEVYADPLAQNIGAIINVILSNPDLAKRVVLRPLLTGAQRDQSNPVFLNRMRSEEAQRWITLANDFTGSYQRYLKSYAENPGSTYWFNWLSGANISKERFLRRVEANEAAMAQYRADVAAISSGDPVMIMLNNRTRVSVPNERELLRLLIQFAGL
ncbi:MAG: hypothetical protein FWE57_06800 [Chitinispirillia bacterium]|nr:hypothetical protein [Chitinispirillia bacterium]